MKNNTDYKEIKQLVEQYLEGFIESKIEEARDYDKVYERLWTEIKRYMSVGGKRLRPYLVVLAYRTHGGTDVSNIIPVAAAWELLHACLLVHDDIIDRDVIRHGHPNIQGAYLGHYESSHDADHFAAGAALLAGDLLLSSAYELIMAANVPYKQKYTVHKLLSKALYGVAGGELMDVETVLMSVKDAQPLKIAHYKTAEYSCEYPLRCGAVLAGVDEGQSSAIKEFAVPLGIGYQIIDDMLGVFGREEVTGKSNSGDLREKKRTLLIQETMKSCKQDDKKRLIALFGKQDELDNDEVEEVRQILERANIQRKMELKIADYEGSALRAIEKLSVEAAAKQKYITLVEALFRRKY